MLNLFFRIIARKWPIVSECANGLFYHNNVIITAKYPTAALGFVKWTIDSGGDSTLISQEKLNTILEQLKAQDGVRGVVVTTMEGLPLSSDLDADTTENVAAIITSLVGKALDTVRLLREGSLSFLTLDTTQGQINIAPDEKEGLILVVLKKN
ncbi:MAG: roadblock/LC7 domain-containing protein [Candidatus Thorarchaeota archaeon]